MPKNEKCTTTTNKKTLSLDCNNSRSYAELKTHKSPSMNTEASNSSISSSRGSGDRGKLRRSEKIFIALVLIFVIISVSTNVLHEYDLSSTSIQLLHPHFAGYSLERLSSHSISINKDVKGEQVNHKSVVDIPQRDDDAKDEVVEEGSSPGKSTHKLGGLSCAAYGGPSDEIASQMVYWSDIPEDSSYESPFKQKKKDGPVRYMTFEPDGGGWNNIRMAMETVVVLAHAMGRTLVLPPAQGMYLLRKDRGKQNTDFSFADFFHLESLANEHSGLDIISTEEFLKREAMTGHMKNMTTGEVSFPPNNRTNWDGQDVKPLKEWLRQVTLTPLWSPGQCLAAFPSSGDPKDAQDLHDMVESIKADGKVDSKFYLDNPTPVDATTQDRMKEALANRDKLCIYDHEMQAAPVIHFMCYHKMRVRLLTHFYSFVFFEDWKQQLWTNRFVRDHLRYIDELQCAAARVVDKLQAIARENGEASGQFDTFHVRRGDFQYKNTRVEADVLYNESKDKIPAKATLYIATDERKKDFFNIFKEHYNVYFLDDFKDLFEGLNTNYYGMLDQLIASKGRTFFGTFYSTFTGYINRMRGYASTKFDLPGGNNGTINSYYFLPSARKEDMVHYRPVKGPFYSREFPTAWYNIDKDVTSKY